MAGRKSDFTLTKLDDLFSTQEQRDEEKLSKIRDISLTEIDDFPDHPFKVRDDEDMAQLVESIKERGIITPATVRQKEDGRYELISGHRRKRACELAGFETLRCEVVDLNRDEATILMVESNYQRSQILPSEKAFAYKMRLEAMKRQGERTDLTCDPLGDKLAGTKSVMLLADKSDDSKTQIQRYVRLTNLVPELLDYVDEGRIKMRPAVELSYLDEDSQRDVVDEIDLNDATPSHDQTIRMRKFFEEGKLTTEAVQAIMSEEKPNQKEKIVLRGDRVRQLRLMENQKVLIVPFAKETIRVRQYRLPTREHKIQKVGGLYGLYLHYCYKLGYLPKYKKQNSARLHYLLKEDLLKLEKITQETRLLGRENISTDEQLFSYKESLLTKIKTLTDDRTHLRKQTRRNMSGDELSKVKEQIATITTKLWTLRKEVNLCDDIAERSKVIEANLETERADEEKQQRKEQNRNDKRR